MYGIIRMVVCIIGMGRTYTMQNVHVYELPVKST